MLQISFIILFQIFQKFSSKAILPIILLSSAQKTDYAQYVTQHEKRGLCTQNIIACSYVSPLAPV